MVSQQVVMTLITGFAIIPSYALALFPSLRSIQGTARLIVALQMSVLFLYEHTKNVKLEREVARLEREVARLEREVARLGSRVEDLKNDSNKSYDRKKNELPIQNVALIPPLPRQNCVTQTEDNEQDV